MNVFLFDVSKIRYSQGWLLGRFTMTELKKWYLAQLKPNSHAIAQRNLERQGFKAFLPMYQATTRQRGRFVSAAKPLFPGYIFVAFDAGGSVWRSVNATQGITKLVSFGSAPAEIPPEFIADLRQRCDESDQVISDTTLKEGTSVVITRGPFTNAVGRILSMDEKQRVWLLLDLMGQQSRLAVDRSAVQAV